MNTTESRTDLMNSLLKEALYKKNQTLPAIIDDYIRLLTETDDVHLVQHANILKLFNKNYVTDINFIDYMRDTLFSQLYDFLLNHHDFLFELIGRRKSFLKTELKIREYTKTDMNNIPNDFFAYRIILYGATYDDVYSVGKQLKDFCIIHGFVLQNTKDYILHQKSNGYRALHLIFQSLEGRTFEVQIKLSKDHLNTEYGAEQNHEEHDKRKYKTDLDIDLTLVYLKHGIFTPYKKNDGTYIFHDIAGFNSSLNILARRQNFY